MFFYFIKMTHLSLYEEMFHCYWIKDSRHRSIASSIHCQMTCPYVSEYSYKRNNKLVGHFSPTVKVHENFMMQLIPWGIIFPVSVQHYGSIIVIWSPNTSSSNGYLPFGLLENKKYIAFFWYPKDMPIGFWVYVRIYCALMCCIVQ